MTESLDDLIQRVLDGDGSAEERTRLDARLASDPRARSRYDDLSRVFQALSAVQVEEAPSGMRDDVLRSIREAALAKTRDTARAGVAVPAVRAPRAGRPAFSWLRLALPIAGGAVAAVVLFTTIGGPPWRAPVGRVSGTMSGAGSADAMRVGSGPAAVVVRWAPSKSGFSLKIQTGAAPVRVVLEGVSPGTALNLAAYGAAIPAPRIEATLPANALVIAEGSAPDTQATVRVTVTLPDGQLASGEVSLRGLRPRR
jgi:anti-sigma factor RsiW